MIRPPPRSTLFPTRRSSDLVRSRSAGRLPRAEPWRRALPVGSWLLVAVFPPGQVGPAPPVLVETPDRKSTRLNSSHLGISYAVFCLKKKNLARRIDSLCEAQ